MMGVQGKKNSISPPATAPTIDTNNSYSRYNPVIVLYWSQVATATGYKIDISTNSSFTAIISGYPVDVNSGDITGKALYGITAGVTYYVRIRAYNLGGEGSNSTTYTAVVPLAPPVITTFADGLLQWSFLSDVPNYADYHVYIYGTQQGSIINTWNPYSDGNYDGLMQIYWGYNSGEVLQAQIYCRRNGIEETTNIRYADWQAPNF